MRDYVIRQGVGRLRAGPPTLLSDRPPPERVRAGALALRAHDAPLTPSPVFRRGYFGGERRRRDRRSDRRFPSSIRRRPAREPGTGGVALVAGEKAVIGQELTTSISTRARRRRASDHHHPEGEKTTGSIRGRRPPDSDRLAMLVVGAYGSTGNGRGCSTDEFAADPRNADIKATRSLRRGERSRLVASSPLIGDYLGRLTTPSWRRRDRRRRDRRPRFRPLAHIPSPGRRPVYGRAGSTGTRVPAIRRPLSLDDSDALLGAEVVRRGRVVGRPISRAP